MAGYVIVGVAGALLGACGAIVAGYCWLDRRIP